MKLFSFPGGVHPPYNKDLAQNEAIRRASVPDMLTVPLVQHIGAPCAPVVETGATVKEGQVIGQAKAFVTAPVHAPVSGKVKKIEKVLHPLGVKVDAVILAVDRESTDKEYLDPMGGDPANLDSKKMIERVSAAGIVGQGGAAFPTHVKFSPPAGKNIDVLIINGCECEPYLTADHRLMCEKPQDLVLGARMIGKMLGVERIIVGIEKNKPGAVDTLKPLAAEAGFELAVTETKYPEGAEKMLIKALTGREVPSGGLPMDVGVVVSNVGTAVAVCEAVRDGKPLIERVVTVTGEGVKNPGNFLVKIGTPLGFLVDEAGGDAGDIGKIILGGPMMGLAQASLDVPIVKGTSGVLLLREQPAMHEGYMSCIHCSFCVNVCPTYLMPTQLSIIAEAERWEMAKEYGVLDCIECGSCTYVCPSRRPIVQWIKTTKAKLRKLKAQEKE